MELKGTIKHIFDTQTVGNNGFKKREMILVTDERYPQVIKIEFVQEKTALLDQFKEGDDVTVSINIRGREWVNPEGKTLYFTSIQGWRIVKSEAETPDDDFPPPLPPEADEFPPPPDEDDDLPF
jgi:translation initiation factor IF-3